MFFFNMNQTPRLNMTFNLFMSPMNILPRGLFSPIFTYFALQLGNGKSDQIQTVVEMTCICGHCLWKI